MSLMTMLADAVWGPYGPPRQHERAELAAYRTGREVDDLMATVDRYPDERTRALRECIFWQSPAARSDRRPWSSPWTAR